MSTGLLPMRLRSDSRRRKVNSPPTSVLQSNSRTTALENARQILLLSFIFHIPRSRDPSLGQITPAKVQDLSATLRTELLRVVLVMSRALIWKRKSMLSSTRTMSYIYCKYRRCSLYQGNPQLIPRDSVFSNP